MKFAAFAFIVGLCAVSVTAHASGNFGLEYEDVQDYEYIAQELADEIVEIEPQSLFSGMFSTFKKALRTVKGLNCTIKQVIGIRDTVNKFIADVKACGGEVSKKVQNLIDACNKISETCKDILGINETVCGNTADEDVITSRTWHVVSGAQNAHKCFVKMLRKLQTLKKQIKSALKLIKQIKNVPADSSQCVLSAVDTLELYFLQWPAKIVACSKLVSKKTA